MKRLVISEPFQDNILPFQKPIYDVARSLGFYHKKARHIPRVLHYFFFHYPINCHFKSLDNNNEARMVFVSGTHIEPMIYPNAYMHEIIPIIWDCWPAYYDDVIKTLKRCWVKIAFFTSSRVASLMSRKLPNIECLYLPEAAVKDLYLKGERLIEREINILEFGRYNGPVHEEILAEKIQNHLFPIDGNHLFSSSYEFAKGLSNSKIAITLPRSITNPELAGGIETLTQRYWECMFSRCIMFGHAPQDLVNFIGYNPVIEISKDDIGKQLKEILKNVDDYQDLVDKNYESACKYGDWVIRLNYIRKAMYDRGYMLK